MLEMAPRLKAMVVFVEHRFVRFARQLALLWAGVSGSSRAPILSTLNWDSQIAYLTLDSGTKILRG